MLIWFVFVLTLHLSSAQILWSGNVTTRSVSVTVSDHDGENFFLSLNENGTDPVYEVALATDDAQTFYVSGLFPGTKYYYGVEGDVGSFRTFNSRMGKLTILAASCANTGSNSPVFEAMLRYDADIFLHTGDLHYKDINKNDVELFNSAYRGVFANRRQKEFFKSLPVAYVWDDHDFGPNNSDETSPSKEAAWESYEKNVPHYPLVDPSGPIYHAFDIGNVRIILSDLRSESNGEKGSIMSDQQKQWLKDEFAKHVNYTYLIWVNPQPWIGPESVGDDNWMGFLDDREEISQHIADLEIKNLFSVSGDAHMVALDDGSNTDYSTGVAGFPVLHAAPLQRPGSAKGGPYSHGCYSYDYWWAEQYGVIEIEDTGIPETTCVTLKGFRGFETEPLVNWTACGPLVINGTGGLGPSCTISSMPLWAWILLAFSIVSMVLFLVLLIAMWLKDFGSLPFRIAGISLLVASVGAHLGSLSGAYFPAHAATGTLSAETAYLTTLVIIFFTNKSDYY